MARSSFKLIGKPYSAIPHPQQGMLVSYFLDPEHRQGTELSGNQVGMVMTTDQFNERSQSSYLVCPYVTERDNRFSDLEVYDHNCAGVFRPDLSTYVGADYLSPVLHNGRSVILKPQLIDLIINKFFFIIHPQSAGPGSDNFVGYGQYAWFQNLFYDDDHTKCEPRPALSITPLSIAERTGQAIVLRGHTSGFNHFLPYAHTAVTLPGFRPSYFSASSFVCVSIDRLDRAPFHEPQSPPLYSLEELHRKIRGTMREEIFQRNVVKYGTKRGMPPYIRHALNVQNPNGPNTQTCQPP